MTQCQMAVLLLVKMLAQRTLETYIHQSVSLSGGRACYHNNNSLFSFVARKVELLSQERVLTELIELIRGQRLL